MANFSVGDVVQLNSGGEKMTVAKVDGDYLNVTWMRDGEVKNFPNLKADMVSVVEKKTA